MTKRCKDCVARVFGACRGDFCEPERIAICELAERKAEERGHVLGPFEKSKKYPIWQAHCERCGRPVSYTLDPGAGEPAIYGEAIETDCEESPELEKSLTHSNRTSSS
jgi:hypothetical protein